MFQALPRIPAFQRSARWCNAVGLQSLTDIIVLKLRVHLLDLGLVVAAVEDEGVGGSCDLDSSFRSVDELGGCTGCFFEELWWWSRNDDSNPVDRDDHVWAGNEPLTRPENPSIDAGMHAVLDPHDRLAQHTPVMNVRDLMEDQYKTNTE